MRNRPASRKITAPQSEPWVKSQIAYPIEADPMISSTIHLLPGA